MGSTRSPKSRSQQLETEQPDVAQVEALVATSRAFIGLAVLSLAELGDRLSLVQLRALVVLTDTGPLKAGELAERIGVSASSVTRLCDRLVTDGLLRRIENPHSRREVLLTASRQGAAIVKRVMDGRRRDFGSILSRMEPERRIELTAALDQFVTAAAEIHGSQILAEWPVS